jgi:alanyl-tRNA synthetase
VKNTSEIRSFIITSESAISTGIRRIEAISGDNAVNYLIKQNNILKEISSKILNSDDPISTLNKLKSQNLSISKKLDKTNNQLLSYYLKDLQDNIEIINDLNFCTLQLSCDPNVLKNLAFNAGKCIQNLCLVLCSVYEEKAYVMCYVSKQLNESKSLDAKIIIEKLGYLIDGSGGGQPFFATLTGKNVSGIKNVLKKARELILG